MLANFFSSFRAKRMKRNFDTHPKEIGENDNFVLSALFHTRWKETFKLVCDCVTLKKVFLLMCSCANVEYVLFSSSLWLISFYILSSFWWILYILSCFFFALCMFFCWRFLLIAIDMIIHSYEKSHDRFFFRYLFTLIYSHDPTICLKSLNFDDELNAIKNHWHCFLSLVFTSSNSVNSSFAPINDTMNVCNF